jgi:YfiH family protein
MPTVALLPEIAGGRAVWRFAAVGARALFVGRGAAAAAGGLPTELLPAGVERAWLRQVHSARVLEAVPGVGGEGDALVVRRPGLAATVATADCVPVLIAAPAALAAVHAGWRGIAAGVVPAALARLGELRGATAWIGPAIGPCCYEVGDEVAAAVVGVSAAGACVVPGESGRPHLDLASAVAHQLGAAGVGRIVTVGACTRCHPEWLWSHRRDGAAAGRNLALIWKGGDDADG